MMIDNKYLLKYNSSLLRAQKLLEEREYKSAVDIYEKIYKKLPNNLTVSHNYGSVLAECGNLESAKEVFLRALLSHPMSFDINYNLGIVYQRLHEPEFSLKYYKEALKIKASDIPTLENMAALVLSLGRRDEAKYYLNEVLQIDATRPGALFTLSLIMLLEGDWHDGWHLYEYRWDTPDFQKLCTGQIIKRWDRIEDVRNRTVLLVSEQGLGDTLQFCRYALLLANYGAQVTLLVQPNLKKIIQSLNNFPLNNPINVLATSELDNGINYDYWIPMLSAPYALMKDYANIPALDQYLFADAESIALARLRVPKNGLPNIGIVWSGSSKHKNDINRSIPFKKFASLISGSANFHILQTEIKEHDFSEVNDFMRSGKLISHSHYLRDFSDTAGLLGCMDLIISVDTSIVHLAGAMGLPTWLALPYSPDFRWLLDRKDTPWYSNIQLYRQPSYNDWDSVLEFLNKDLIAFVNKSLILGGSY